MVGVDAGEEKLILGLRLGDEECELKAVVGVGGNDVGGGVRNMD